MKKLICLVFVMLLCVSAASMAMAVGSKTTTNMTGSTGVVTPTGTAAPEEIVIAPIAETAGTPEQRAACEKLIGEIASASSLEEVFGELQDSEGEVLDLAEILGTDKPVINEIVPLVVQNYIPTFGSLKSNFTFSTPYQKGEPVVVVIRVVDPKTGAVKQFTLKGVGNGIDGGIELEFPPEVLEEIQSGTATMAVISK